MFSARILCAYRVIFNCSLCGMPHDKSLKEVQQ
nr:MAG TPA: C2H2 type zinc-finger protein [Caudoviricetes sp.]